MAKAEQRSPFAPAPLQGLPRHYGLLRPCAPHRYSRPCGWSRLRLLPSHHRRDGAQVLTFHTKAWSSFAPPTCRMSLGQSQASPELIPEEDAMGGGADIASIVADVNRWSNPMQKLNDLSRSLSPLQPDGTLIAVIELSLSS